MMAMAHARPQRKSKVGTDEKERTQQKSRKSSLFIRKIPVTHQIEDVRPQMRKCPGIPLKDLTITQPIPNSEFTGKWKYMSCEGPTTALEMLTQACEKRNLPWRINSAPPTRPTPFFKNQTHKPHRELAARPEVHPKPFTPQHRPHLNTHPFPPPLSLPLSFNMQSCIAKAFAKIINNRLSNYLESNCLLYDEQNGFRKGRCCQDHISSLYFIIENRKLSKQDTYACFVDFRNAFDSVPRELLWSKLSHSGINNNIYSSIKALYTNTRSSIKIDNNLSSPIFIKRGVKQGCPLSPTLFNIFINDLIG